MGQSSGPALLCLALSSAALLGLARRLQAPSGAKAMLLGRSELQPHRQWATPPTTQKLHQRPRTTLVDETKDPGLLVDDTKDPELRPQQVPSWGGTPYHPQADRLVKDLAFLCAHAGAMFAPFYFTGDALACFLLLYPMAAMCEMALAYQRQLPQASCRSQKLVEYFIAYCGVLTMQSHLENGVLGRSRSGEEAAEKQSDRSQNRPNLTGTDLSYIITPNWRVQGGYWWSRLGWLYDEKDYDNGVLGRSHSGEESDEKQSDRQQHHHQQQQQQSDEKQSDRAQQGGSWWSRLGWLFDEKDSPTRVEKMDVSDRYFYMFLRRTYYLHAVVVPVAALYLYGGLPFVFWGFFVRIVAQQPACLRDLLPARAT